MRRGFTLIELLVVIAIIAVLIAMLLPALGRARQSGTTLKDLSNVRQLETAHTMYYGDYDEEFIDAGLPHGGVYDKDDVLDAWPVTLEAYCGGPVALRSPGDRSRYWPIAEGGQCEGMSLATFIELAEGGLAPDAADLCRWTSYGLNNFTTRSADPFIWDAAKGKALGPWDALRYIPRPSATAHFLLMTEGGEEASEEFARSDHVHAEDWGEPEGAPEQWPKNAAKECETNAFGGAWGSWDAQSNYGFLDGHAATRHFRDVFTNRLDNNFFPDVAH
jgi:prepilin-type N-terminal cleavage/methylation domain-containing protein/prepilin-type processing-associated H-X9-DG protein